MIACPDKQFRKSHAIPPGSRPKGESSSKKPGFLAEPAGPIVKTAIPGPEGKKAITELDKVFKTRSLIY